MGLQTIYVSHKLNKNIVNLVNDFINMKTYSSKYRRLSIHEDTNISDTIKEYHDGGYNALHIYVPYSDKYITYEFLKDFHNLKALSNRAEDYDFNSLKRSLPNTLEVFYNLSPPRSMKYGKDYDLSFVDGFNDLISLDLGTSFKSAPLKLNNKLNQLRFLYLWGYDSKRIKVSLGNYPNLIDLVTNIDDAFNYFDFSQAPHLNSLWLTTKRNREINFEGFYKLPETIEKLILIGFHQVKKLPNFSHLPNLKEVQLIHFGELEDVSSIESIKNLEYLHFHLYNKEFDLGKFEMIHRMGSVKRIGGCRGGFFLKDEKILKDLYGAKCNMSLPSSYYDVNFIRKYDEPGQIMLHYMEGYFG